MNRYILEGRLKQTIAHREIIDNPERYKKLKAITFGDHSTLVLELRQAKPRERIKPIYGFVNLIERAVDANEETVDVGRII